MQLYLSAAALPPGLRDTAGLRAKLKQSQDFFVGTTLHLSKTAFASKKMPNDFHTRLQNRAAGPAGK